MNREKVEALMKPIIEGAAEDLIESGLEDGEIFLMIEEEFGSAHAQRLFSRSQ
jgi:hypothetical protein